MQVHASPRITMDLDLTVTFEQDNRERLAAALAEVDARLIGPNGEIAASPPSASFLGGGDIWFFQTRFGKLDIVSPPLGSSSFEGLRDRAVEVQLGDLTVPVASREDMIQMKRAAGRPQDLADLEFLELLPNE